MKIKSPLPEDSGSAIVTEIGKSPVVYPEPALVYLMASTVPPEFMIATPAAVVPTPVGALKVTFTLSLANPLPALVIVTIPSVPSAIKAVHANPLPGPSATAVTAIPGLIVYP